MRKVILNVAVSLDGLIEGPNGEYDWCFDDEDYGLTPFFLSIDAIFIGRKSYDMIRAQPNMFPGKKMYVFSDTLVPREDEDVEVIGTANFEHAVEGIINEAGKSIWLFGGASLVSAFLDKRWITELHLSVHPIILGAGKPLFESITEKVDLQFISQQVYNSGLIQLHYALKPKFDMEMLKLL
ncbi:dihydrofolate reductase family protein [Mucilaginibacter gilvus]|uniref:Dihydrofolate reductase n=1 Tax=Mucilaginibacter gilvus TaxID=2305909 RepID=A0A3S3YMM3_9SPHI|nr:dihydrofolate reductase family protein [Mucilaginibacter gilvus]RWY46273.1 dihydrofolate reductase [Mucilaginibacter gilvus]